MRQRRWQRRGVYSRLDVSESRPIYRACPQNKMARPVGVEPTTYRFEVWRSIQLSYGRTVRQLYAAPSRSSKWWTLGFGGWGE